MEALLSESIASDSNPLQFQVLEKTCQFSISASGSYQFHDKGLDAPLCTSQWLPWMRSDGLVPRAAIDPSAPWRKILRREQINQSLKKILDLDDVDERLIECPCPVESKTPIETIQPLFQMPITMNTTKIIIHRNTMDGNVTGYSEQTLSSSSQLYASATNSMQMDRAPGALADANRGQTKYLPFQPGGMEERLNENETMIPSQLQESLMEPLQTVAPGMPRGLFSNETLSHTLDESMMLGIEALLLEDEEEKNLPEKEELQLGDNRAVPQTDEAIDALLPNDDTSLLSIKRATVSAAQQQWAHVVDITVPFLDFHERHPRLAHEYPFELDTFQKRAIDHLEQGHHVFVAAHTSAGKTVVAEYAMALAQRHMTKSIYTSPIKALSNQKFRDFTQTFKSVGLLTGDVQLSPDASCLIMTTEILRSMLYRGADVIRDVEFVIFDECHYVNDMERGVVWEEVIIMLPAHVKIILLSATVPNTMEFADWVGRTKKSPVYVISTLHRPVPLEHFLFVNQLRPKLYKIVDGERNYLANGYKDALQALQEKGSRGAAGQGNATARKFVAVKQDKNMWIQLVHFLKQQQLLPVVCFTFSKKKCESQVDALSNVDLCTSDEKSAIFVFLERSLTRLSAEDRHLPQLQRMKMLMMRGLAVHHSGLLPIVKEAVEILFARGLIKVLFATETFAMGVNMPARTVVFASIKKHDGQQFRELLPGEYTQMSGRAGRRGLDATGVVIIACDDDVPEDRNLKQLLLGQPTRLQSQFRLTFSMMLSLLRVEQLRVEDMIKKSFSEHGQQKERPLQAQQLAELQEKFTAMERVDCSLCKELNVFYEKCVEIKSLQKSIISWMTQSVAVFPRVFCVGRVFLVSLLRGQHWAVLEQVQWPRLSCSILVDAVLDKDGSLDTTNAIPWPIHELSKLKQPILRKVDIHPLDISWLTSHKLILTDALLSQLMTLHESVSIPELDTSKWKDVSLHEWLTRRRYLSSLLHSPCPLFQQHFLLYHKEAQLRDEMARLSYRMSEQNLNLLPEYQQRLDILKELNYIDGASRVLLKGRVACEINTVDALIVTELLMHNAFQDSAPEEIASILSCLVFQERSASDERSALLDILPPVLFQGWQVLCETTLRLLDLQQGLQTSLELEDILNPALMLVVYQWALGTPFQEITPLTDILEGSIVRCITRLDETCRELKSASRLMGDTQLYKKMELAQSAIRRDICFAASLYY